MHHLDLRRPRARVGRLVAIYLLVLSLAAGLTGAIISRHDFVAGTHVAAGPVSLVPSSKVSSASSVMACRNISHYPILPQSGKIFMGVTTPHAGWSMNGTAKFSQQVGTQPLDVMFYAGWGGKPAFDATPFNNIHNAGMMPMLDWEPWNYLTPSATTVGKFNQSNFSDASLMSGSYLGFIESWALGIKKLGYPVALSFAHEMNGNWYPWAASVNGNSPASFVALWKYVHDIFSQVGANNVIWVWSPNVSYPGSTTLSSLWPGSNYVNWAGVVGYYWGSANASTPSFSQIFGPTLRQIAKITNKPVMITETAGSNSSGQKIQWMSSFFRGLASHPQIIGFNWFNIVKHHNWTVASSPGALNAFRNGLATISLATFSNPHQIGASGTTLPVSIKGSGNNCGKTIANKISPNTKNSSVSWTGTLRSPVSVKAEPQNSSAVVSWSAPSAQMSNQIIGYIVTPYLGTIEQPPSIFKNIATTEHVTDLTNGDSYTFRVAAMYSGGVSAKSAPSAAIVPSITSRLNISQSAMGKP